MTDFSAKFKISVKVKPHLLGCLLAHATTGLLFAGLVVHTHTHEPLKQLIVHFK